MNAAEQINRRIAALREKMAERGVDACLIPTADFHGSEYVNEYFKCREFITGFTGSAGTAVVTADQAGLWTDGRYFVQAAGELSGTEVTLYRMGETQVPTVEEFLEQQLPEGGCLAFDGRVVSGQQGEELERRLLKKNVRISCKEDLVGLIWSDRPVLPAEPIWILEETYAGESAGHKLERVRKKMKELGADVHLVTRLDDISWLLNLRGGDIACTPVFLSYLLLAEKEAFLFVQQEAVSMEVKQYLEQLGICLMDYESVYEETAKLQRETILLEKEEINYTLLKGLAEQVQIVNQMNPSAEMKAVKNAVEIEQIKKAHKKDGVVMVRFIRWLKQAVKEQELNECAASARLDAMRAEQEGFLDLSFHTISAYGANAAMCHYSAVPESCAVLKPKGLYLVDSGAQYLDGTTDVTRTIALGELTRKEKEYFTLVSCGMLRLLEAKFPYGSRGVNVDYAARELLWKRGLDFNHGTGHGVGFVGGVHERPNSIRWRLLSGGAGSAVLEAGMVTSDEPGLYLEGEFGIRTENLTLCKEAEKTAFGQFLCFENLTWVPIDLDAIAPEIMEEADRLRLNRYHQAVYENLAPYLSEEERTWLAEATREI